MSLEKTPSDSALITRHGVMPQHANPGGSLFGGQLLAWIDTAAGMVAQRHAGRLTVVTASIDRVDFLQPVRIGEQLVIQASVNCVGTSSMEIGVRVSTENAISGERRQCTRAYLTFVALDENGCPTPVPKLRTTSSEEERRMTQGMIRQQHRRELHEKIKSGESPPGTAID